MAQKRMFDKTITNSDEFIEMPDSSQNLYFHLSMNADDDGFVNNWKSIMRMTGHKEDDLKVLISKQFIIPFETGVIVIKHWRINNYLRSDRYTETKFKDEKKQLYTDENLVYQLATTGIPSIDKNRLDKNRLDNNIYISEKSEIKNQERKKINSKESYGKYNRIKLKPEEYTKLIEEYGEDFIKIQIDLLDEYIESNNNKNKYTNFNLVLRKSIRENWFKNKKNENKKTNPFLDIVKEDYYGRQ